MIQIDFFSADIVNMLVPVYSTAPEKVYFLIDKSRENDNEPKYIKNAIMEWGNVKSVEFVSVDSCDIVDINDKLSKIIATHNEDVYIDLTGGSELMIACGYSVCTSEQITPIYADLKKGIIYNVTNRNVLCDVKHICLNDYLNAVGAKRLAGSHTMPSDSDAKRIMNMSRMIFKNIDKWHALHSYLTANVKPYSDSVKLPKQIMYKSSRYDVRALVDAFCDNGFITSDGKSMYTFADCKAKEYMITFGIWLEMFVYFKAKEYFDETELGVIIDWNESDYIDTEDNEIDVLAIKNSIPVFISCKMKKVVASEVYEAGFLADRLGGRCAEAIVATTFPVSTEGDGIKGIYQRFKKMHVGFVEVSDLDKKGVDKVMRDALQLAK